MAATVSSGTAANIMDGNWRTSFNTGSDSSSQYQAFRLDFGKTVQVKKKADLVSKIDDLFEMDAPFRQSYRTAVSTPSSSLVYHDSF